MSVSTTRARVHSASGPLPHIRLLEKTPVSAAKASRLSPRTAFYLQASIILFFLAGSSAPTPLYSVYQTAWGFSPIAVTVVFGIYAIAVLAALLVVGRLSDHLGRRPILFITTLVQAAAMLIFATSHGLGSLIVARVVQGLATGAAAGAVGAGMLDIDRAKGTIANAVGPMLGTATGGLLSGLLVTFLPAPTLLVYLLLAAVFLAQAGGVLLMSESAIRRPGALASLRPSFFVPREVRGPLLWSVPALVATWSLAGFYGSLGPTLVRRLMGSTSLLWGGVILFVLAGSAVVAVLVSQKASPRLLTLSGTAALFVGVGLGLIGIESGLALLLFVGVALAGAGFGQSFQGAVRSVLPLAAPQERAGVLSVVYLVAYLAMGVPAVFAGIGVVYGGGLLLTARQYGLGVMLLAAAAWLGGWRRPPTPNHRPSS